MSLSLRIPPVVMVLLVAVLQWLLAQALPRWSGDFPGRVLIAIVLLLIGMAVAISGVLSFRRARTSVNPMDPGVATTLVSNGVYRYSRNPMYLGFAAWLCAWAVLLGSLPALLLAGVFVAYMNRFQIVPEERALAALFGEDFERYRRRVRRWL